MTIFRFALLRSVRNRMNLLLLTLFPIGCIFLPSGGQWPALPYGYQYFGIVILFVSVRLAAIMLEDRVSGVVKRLAVAPISYYQYLGQQLAACSLILIGQCVLVVLGGVLAGQELYRPLPLLTLYISFSFTSLAIALAWVYVYRSKEIAVIVYLSLVFLAAVLGGLMLPVQMFPEWLARISVVLPTYWLAEGLNWVVAGSGAGASNTSGAAEFVLIHVVLWLYAAVFVIMGSMRKNH